MPKSRFVKTSDKAAAPRQRNDSLVHLLAQTGAVAMPRHTYGRILVQPSCIHGTAGAVPWHHQVAAAEPPCRARGSTAEQGPPQGEYRGGASASTKPPRDLTPDRTRGDGGGLTQER